MTYEYEPVATPSSGLRLHLNENTGGCSPMVLASLHAMTGPQISLYPDYEAAHGAVAARLGVPDEQLLLTNGLDEGILAVSLAAMRGASPHDPFESVVPVPAFDMYAACADTAGARVVLVPPEPDFSFPLERMIDTIWERTRLVWLTNPNNPTGQIIPRDAISRIADTASGAIVFVDEAYVDFGGESLIGSALLDRHPNIIVGRTFSKAYGLAGLRVGALVGSPAMLAPLRRILPPYRINACAAIALPIACLDTAYYHWYLDQVHESKALLYDCLDRLGAQYWKSAANFVFARFPGSGPRIVRDLAARQVYVRDRSSLPGCADCMRMTAGVVDETRTLAAALEEVACGAAS